jgi:hypothetical protein
MPNVRPSGVTAIDAILGAATVRLVDCDTVPRLAEIFVVPAASELARPVELIVAIAVDEEPQETKFVRSEVLPSP